MPDEIVKLLREDFGLPRTQDLCGRAADEIERLRAEIARLREWDPVINAVDAERRRLRAALERIALDANVVTNSGKNAQMVWMLRDIARAALAGAAVPASVGHPVCQSCGAFVDSRGKCRIPEHNP